MPVKDNPIHAAIKTWARSISPPTLGDDFSKWLESLLHAAPKRFTIYRPMALLPAGSFLQTPWIAILRELGKKEEQRLHSSIVSEISKHEKGSLTHLAITEGIPLQKEGSENENILRSPNGLRMLYGDFGPSEVNEEPTQEAFDEAFWVSTKQNGIQQTWAPRWTMFSRGNIKEKARLLDFNRAEGSHEWAVDLYAGIGYFVFSYASLGFRVLCWEINPWSVEGLLRGAGMNRWSVRVVQGDNLGLPLGEIMSGDEQIVVFLEDNQKALGRIKEMQSSLGLAKEVRHVNCGFLPTSRPTWRPALEMVEQSSEAWLHLHENVGVADIPEVSKAMVGQLRDETLMESQSTLEVSHVERVKTFAPDVWHCVFDVHVQSSKQ